MPKKKKKKAYQISFETRFKFPAYDREEEATVLSGDDYNDYLGGWTDECIACVDHEHYCLACRSWCTDEHLKTEKHDQRKEPWTHRELEAVFDDVVQEPYSVVPLERNQIAQGATGATGAWCLLAPAGATGATGASY